LRSLRPRWPDLSRFASDVDVPGVERACAREQIDIHRKIRLVIGAGDTFHPQAAARSGTNSDASDEAQAELLHHEVLQPEANRDVADTRARDHWAGRRIRSREHHSRWLRRD
jgi:hypothetical protein